MISGPGSFIRELRERRGGRYAFVHYWTPRPGTNRVGRIASVIGQNGNDKMCVEAEITYFTAYKVLNPDQHYNFSEVCSEWVNCTTETLRRLAILDHTSNIYGGSPLIKKSEFNESPSVLDTPIPSPAQMSADASPRHRVYPHDPHCMNRNSQFHPPHSIKPPLPPRSNTQFPNRPHTVSSDSEPRIEDTTYDVLTPQSRVSCDTDKDGDCSSLSSELRLSSSIPPGEISNGEYDCLRTGNDHPAKSVALNLSVLVEQVLFVEVAGRVWVAGWSEMKDRHLDQLFSFGDELIEVEGTPVQGISSIPQLFYTLSTPGTPVNLLLRPTPFGVTYRLMKPITKNKEIGIRLHKNKNRVSLLLSSILC
ncbi:unnamed protein product [Strongylus vulgaris]|uniref:PDZ domain-containing protein n=1 Tax=Strongylus vulgaris TaxID=40348 RepID=A0A3P7J5M5_STRVU|nr:unnamed protein product [Strongylus vulgaris]